MGCLKITENTGAIRLGKNHFFLGDTYEKKEVPQIFCNDYYPFGLSFNSYARAAITDQNFKFNAGSELESMTDWYSTPFRKYDPSLGRFHGVDLLASKYTSLTPSHFASNNPIMFNDPSGLDQDDGEGDPSGGWIAAFMDALAYLADEAMGDGMLTFATDEEGGIDENFTEVTVQDGEIMIKDVTGEWVSAKEVASETNPNQNKAYRKGAETALNAQTNGGSMVDGVWVPNNGSGLPPAVDLFGGNALAGLVNHFRFVGRGMDGGNYHLKNVVKSMATPSSGNVLVDWYKGFFGGSMVNARQSGVGTFNGATVKWTVWPANWGGTGSESTWQDHSWNNIGGIGHSFEGGQYQIRLYGANNDDPRVMLNYSNFNDFNNAWADFTGNPYR